jgi:hypothetical protein
VAEFFDAGQSRTLSWARRPQAAALVAALADPDRGWADAVWGRRAHRLGPDPATAPVVAWIFSQSLAGRSAARITRALNDAGIPCPSAADPERNPHRTGAAWTLRTMAAIRRPRAAPCSSPHRIRRGL